MQLKGPNFSTYIITAYQCAHSRSKVGTVFMQRKTFLKQNNMSGCLIKIFISDLMNFMTSLLDGNRTIF